LIPRAGVPEHWPPENPGSALRAAPSERDGESQHFSTDFLFELTAEEFSSLMLQNATSKRGRGGRRKLPLAFTEHGAIQG